jgi:hypothetical protein
MQKILSKRTLKFIALAKDEATTDGYLKYAPITGGPWVNGLIILLLTPVIACCLVWSFLLRLFGRKERAS